MSVFARRTDVLSHNHQTLTYMPLYYQDQVNHCPGCAGTNWYLGRFSAECAQCHTALPLAQSLQQSMQPVFIHGHGRPAKYSEYAFA